MEIITRFSDFSTRTPLFFDVVLKINNIKIIIPIKKQGLNFNIYKNDTNTPKKLGVYNYL